MLKKKTASLVAFATVLSVSGSAMADWRNILNLNSDMCMGVLHGTMQPGQPIVQWPCITGDLDQTWNVPSSPVSQIQIQNAKDPSFCLAAADFNEGSQLVILPCAESPPVTSFWETYWFADFGTQIPGFDGWVLSSDMSGWTASVAAPNNTVATTAGTGIIQWADQVTGNFTHPEQQWLFGEQSLSFAMGGWGEVLNTPLFGSNCSSDSGGSANVTGGTITVLPDGRWSTSTGNLDIHIHSVGTQSFHTNIACTIPGTGFSITWYCQPGGNAFKDPTCSLGVSSGTTSSIADNWPSVEAAWQRSSTIFCNVSSCLE
jgi:hypothetical protein